MRLIPVLMLLYLSSCLPSAGALNFSGDAKTVEHRSQSIHRSIPTETPDRVPAYEDPNLSPKEEPLPWGFWVSVFWFVGLAVFLSFLGAALSWLLEQP